MILHGDCLEELQKLDADSIDFVCTDPPYGYSFMGKDWDKALPSVDIWRECLRVLKPGAFMCVMSAPRSDVQCAMASRLQEAGFRLDFTPIYWTYASGFPKAGNIGKLVDRRLGAKRELTRSGTVKRDGYGEDWDTGSSQSRPRFDIPVTDQAKALDGSYTGFQPKPAIEVIVVAMKPLECSTYVDQALKNGKGISWLDDCRVPTESGFQNIPAGPRGGDSFGKGGDWQRQTEPVQTSGRFPANLLVSDDVLNDGVERKGTKGGMRKTALGVMNDDSWQPKETVMPGYEDKGSYSRYFDLDAWFDKLLENLPEQQRETFPFLIVPKASKSEKNKGLEDRESVTVGDGRKKAIDNPFQRGKTERVNVHPTVKPLKLMSYLITLFSRPGDVVLDPFVGSGTTCLAAEMLDHESIGIEQEAKYVEIAKARLEHTRYQRSLLSEAGHEATADEV